MNSQESACHRTGWPKGRSIHRVSQSPGRRREQRDSGVIQATHTASCTFFYDPVLALWTLLPDPQAEKDFPDNSTLRTRGLRQITNQLVITVGAVVVEKTRFWRSFVQYAQHRMVNDLWKPVRLRHSAHLHDVLVIVLSAMIPDMANDHLLQTSQTQASEVAARNRITFPESGEVAPKPASAARDFHDLTHVRSCTPQALLWTPEPAVAPYLRRSSI